jgi:hypothetical protein
MFWVALGLGAGVTTAVMASRWAKKQAERVAPANVAKQAGGVVRDLGTLLAETAAEFKRGTEEKEAEIRASLSE